ncbi:MAG: DUF4136 domain-containing protein [Bacteroidota bacterium]|nr:DUF4136 domain-containing protein [Bacteroidota bacterium]
MKTIQLLIIGITAVFIASCSSVKVVSDYDKSLDYTKYNTYAFFTDGINKVEIHDLDKKRILKAIERELQAKGMQSSSNPDVMINFSTKSTERVDVHNYGWGWGWYPWYWGGGANYGVYRSVEGVLCINIIDARKKELIWQGIGEGGLSKDIERKEERINQFVHEILSKYPPQPKK